ncbi:MAG: hypothetical protein IKD31_05225 [Clostridia bacterium]|nr:hypothetical protein [Clostridia bacterium]
MKKEIVRFPHQGKAYSLFFFLIPKVLGVWGTFSKVPCKKSPANKGCGFYDSKGQQDSFAFFIPKSFLEVWNPFFKKGSKKRFQKKSSAESSLPQRPWEISLDRKAEE